MHAGVVIWGYSLPREIVIVHLYRYTCVVQYRYAVVSWWKMQYMIQAQRGPFSTVTNRSLRGGLVVERPPRDAISMRGPCTRRRRRDRGGGTYLNSRM